MNELDSAVIAASCITSVITVIILRMFFSNTSELPTKFEVRRMIADEVNCDYHRNAINFLENHTWFLLKKLNRLIKELRDKNVISPAPCEHCEDTIDGVTMKIIERKESIKKCTKE